MRLLFLYFSGTGNTDCVARYLRDKLAYLPIDIGLRSTEHQPADAVAGFDVLAVGFPVYACDAPAFVQAYLARLPLGEGRGCYVFCTKGAYAGGAVGRSLHRLAARGYVPLGGGSVVMPGSDGLALIGKDSWMAHKALDKDFDHLTDADCLAEQMTDVFEGLLAGRPVEAFRETQAEGSRVGLADRIWAAAYKATENWARARLHADDACEGCGLCSRICPVDNIDRVNGRPNFGDQCALCMRCIHACPSEAIQIGGLTKGKFRWKGPKGEFKPLRMRPGSTNAMDSAVSSAIERRS